ncbi:hypothetical protein KAR91_69465 [Candidatus Pacearchaeota archaeon]|nr:hypothetical protein [Candidatus Pacearchaeota archaeon]
MMSYQEKIEDAYEIAEKAGKKEVCEVLEDGELVEKQEEWWGTHTPQEIFEEILLSDLI